MAEMGTTHPYRSLCGRGGPLSAPSPMPPLTSKR